MNEAFLVIGAGLGLGVLHSFDPDHLAAMSTIVGRERRSARADFRQGAVWGLGHTLSLAMFGAALVLLDAQLGGVAERVLEALAGVLLIYLGWRRLRDARHGPHLHHHRHGAHEHAHVHLHPKGARHDHAAAHAQHSHAPLWIGLLHGLAGTGGVMVLLPAVITGSVTGYLVYVVAFGAGSVLSMGGFCIGLGGAMSVLRERSHHMGRVVGAAAGSLSLGVGVVWLTAALVT